MKKILAGWRHPLRVVAMAMAALSLAWGVALTEGLVAAMVGAALGVVAGELLGRSRLRLGVVAGGLGLLVLFAWKLGALLVGTEFLASWVGPGNALAGVGVVRFGSLAFGLIAAVRAVAVRKPAALAVEVALIAAAVTGVFASHRDGVIARPLWLSDWAWQEGIDPAQVFLAIGAVSVGLLCILLVAETKSGRALSSLIALALLAFLGVSVVNVVGAPTPASENVLGTSDAGTGQPPRHTQGDGGHGPNGQEGDAGDGGSQPRFDGAGDGPGSDASDDLPDTGTGFDVIDGGDGSASSTADGGDGGASGAMDGGDGDGGGASGGDAGDGSSAGGGDASDGDGASGGGQDGAGDMPMPMYPTDGAIDPNVPPPQDGGDYSPPQPSDQFNNNDGPSRSPYPVAVVVFDDDYSPPSGAYYFRQEIWSQIAGPRLVKTTRNDVDLDVVDDFPTVPTRLREVPGERGRTRVDARVALLVRNQTLPFGLESVVTFAPAQNPNPQRFSRAYRFSSLAQSISLRDLIAVAGHGPPPPVDLAGDAGADDAAVDASADDALVTPAAPANAVPDDVALVDAARADASLAADAHRDVATGDAGVRWTGDVLRYYTTPHPDPRFRQLALRVLDEQFTEMHIPARLRDNQVVQASLINRWAYKEFIYSTRERHANVPDPTIDFLFGNRTGYCVHFAHAAVFLWRSLGIPSRISTGYHSDESNRRSGSSLIIRGGDAHAWPELFVRGHGWIVLDVAAERNLDPPGTPPDEDLQRILGEMARQLPPEPDAPPAQERPRPNPHYGRKVGFGLLGLLGAVLVGMYLVKLWRRLAPALAGARALPRVAYRAALDRLAEAGLSREYGESREAFAARVKAVAPSFAAMTDLHVSAGLGDPKRDVAATEAYSKEKWRELARAFAKELPANTKRWRRILGLLHPGQWLDAR